MTKERIFFGKLTGEYGQEQFNKHYVKASGSEWFGKLEIKDYAFIGFKSKIALWQVVSKSKENDGTKFDFNVIIEDIGLNTKKFRNLKFLCINPTLVFVQRQGVKGFNELTTYKMNIDEITKTDYYKNESNFRKILIKQSENDLDKDSDDLQLYLENNKLKLWPSGFIDPDTAKKFKDLRNRKNGSRPRKNSILNKMDMAIIEKKHVLSYDNLSIADLYDAFFCDYKEKTVDEQNEEDIMNEKIDSAVQLLKNTKNIILHGAPGTGKTYLAKELIAPALAKELNCEVEIGFVQFHPSYDYTDFVEGIRPTPDGKFKLEDGIFKKFCRHALEKLHEKQQINEDKAYDLFINEIKENPINLATPKQNKNFEVRITENKLYVVPETEKATHCYIKKTDIMAYLKDGKILDWDSYIPPIGDYIKKIIDRYSISKFVFIIDEINRGEMSKIFGELFFSIDPDYRGEKGKIKTQYQNLVKENNVFYDGFYVPENVYIIGTMNDIDRSVESMDFAMRRRFTFKEITAKDSEEMLTSSNEKLKNVPPSIIDKLKECMENLNNEIWKKDDNTGQESGLLSSAYHIGAAYFLKFADYYDPKKENKDTAFQNLWDYNLEPLLQEYLRGQDPTGEKLGKLKAAYNKSEDNQTDQTNS